MGEMDGASFVLFFYTPNEMFGTGKCEEYGSLGERFKNMPSMKLAIQEFEAEIKSIQGKLLRLLIYLTYNLNDISNYS